MKEEGRDDCSAQRTIPAALLTTMLSLRFGLKSVHRGFPSITLGERLYEVRHSLEGYSTRLGHLRFNQSHNRHHHCSANTATR
jgi:hypothetical protein